MSNEHFYTDFGQTVDKIISKYDKYIFIGDFNYDMLNCEKSAMLRDICDIFNMKNIVKKATCFTKIAKATLLDLILPCQECDFKKVCNFGTGFSDVHNFIAVQLNCDLPKMFPKKKLCRSFKNFDVTNFLQDLENQNLDMSNFDNVNSAYDHFSKYFDEVADKHAPFKERKIFIPNQVPYIRPRH